MPRRGVRPIRLVRRRPHAPGPNPRAEPTGEEISGMRRPITRLSAADPCDPTPCGPAHAKRSPLKSSCSTTDPAPSPAPAGAPRWPRHGSRRRVRPRRARGWVPGPHRSSFRPLLADRAMSRPRDETGIGAGRRRALGPGRRARDPYHRALRPSDRGGCTPVGWSRGRPQPRPGRLRLRATKASSAKPMPTSNKRWAAGWRRINSPAPAKVRALAESSARCVLMPIRGAAPPS